MWQKPNLLNCGLAVAEAVPRPFTPVGFSFWVFPSTLRSLGFRPHSEHDLGYNLLPHRCIAEITKARKAQNQLLFHGTLFFVLLRATHCAGIRSMELARFRLALKGQMPRTCMGLALKIDYCVCVRIISKLAGFAVHTSVCTHECTNYSPCKHVHLLKAYRSGPVRRR